MKKLTEHFSLEEMTKTYVKGFNNIPNAAQTNNLKRLCGWLERLRHEWNSRYGDGDDPIIINSAFRSSSINKAVGGSATSNHLSGSAADIRVLGMEQLMRYATILLDISDKTKENFDELLMERKGNSLWLHFAVRPSSNRRVVKFIGC